MVGRLRSVLDRRFGAYGVSFRSLFPEGPPQTAVLVAAAAAATKPPSPSTADAPPSSADASLPAPPAPPALSDLGKSFRRKTLAIEEAERSSDI